MARNLFWKHCFIYRPIKNEMKWKLTFTAGWLEQGADPYVLPGPAAALLLRHAHPDLPRGGAARGPEVGGRQEGDVGQARRVTQPLGQPHWEKEVLLSIRAVNTIIPQKPVDIRMLSKGKYFIFSSPLASQNLTGHKSLGAGRIILMVMDVIGSCYWSSNNYVRQTAKNNPGPIFIFSVSISGHDMDNYPSFVIAISFSKVFTSMNPHILHAKTRWCPPKYFMIHLLKVNVETTSFRIVQWFKLFMNR